MESAYTLTVGLEIHAELRTATKMFCRSRNDPDEPRANQNICPVCMSHPGTLPVINHEALKHVLKVGLAVGGTLADYTEFDRKNYFYPDLPKGYQISQYEYPLVSGGRLNDVDITRIHLEEDTARSSHDASTGATLIDYNRAGVPLMELVTEPVIHTAEDAGAFAREFRLLLRTIGASDANMEKGEMRLEVNISISKDETLGTKVEVKNINSIKAAERAISYEFERQSKILEEGGVIEQETRGWDEMAQKTFSQRIKEGSADYRYFPDPDLPSLKLSEISEFEHQRLMEELPVLPWQLRAQYMDMGLSPDDAEMYVRDRSFGSFFDAVHSEIKKTGDEAMLRTASNYITTDLAKIIRDSGLADTEENHTILIAPHAFADIIRMIGRKELSSRGAKDLLAIVATDGGSPIEIARTRGLLQSNDTEALMPVIQVMLAEHPAVVAEYKAGKEAVIQFLIGQGVKVTKGAADPAILKEIIAKAINA
jgi:aspartyl-tRNA(Asn)/glutamyl-tRNA(Gln) amidotransferase subunit B